MILFIQISNFLENKGLLEKYKFGTIKNINIKDKKENPLCKT